MSLEIVKKSASRMRKEAALERFLRLAREYPTIMLSDFSRIPAAHFGKVRKELTPYVKFLVIKKTILKKACELSDRRGLKELVKDLPMNLVVIFSKRDPFETYRLVSERKVEVFMKPGDLAEEDIVLPAGPTELAPGPILMDLRAMNIPTKIQGGKVAIAESVTLLKKGERASVQIADLLRSLNIKPLKVGFRIKGALDDEGLVYSAEVLSVSLEDVLKSIQMAHSRSLNLAIEIGEINKHTVVPITQRAVRRALVLSLGIGWLSDATIPILIWRATRVARALREKVGT